MNEKFYRYSLYLLLTLTFLFSIFLIVSDSKAPFTTSANYAKTMTHIAPKTSGVVEHIYVKEGQKVRSGQVLFALDNKDQSLALAKAKDQFLIAKTKQQGLQQNLLLSLSDLKQKQIELALVKQSEQRILTLASKSLISRQKTDEMEEKLNNAMVALEMAKTNITRSNIELEVAKQQVKLAQTSINQAKLAEEDTQVKANTRGIVTNLLLSKGSFVNKGSTAILISNTENFWLIADFNERGLSKLVDRSKVLIAFDAYPGEVYEGQIQSIDDAINNNTEILGKLADVPNNIRWIREHQNIRTRIKLDNVVPRLIAGSKASVMLFPASGFWHYSARSWMTLLSYFRYIY